MSILKIILVLVLILIIIKIIEWLYFYKTRSLIKHILKDNDLIKENTKIRVSSTEINIKNYKLKSDVQIEKIIEILELETHQKYYSERKNKIIKIKKFPEIPRERNIYLQNVSNGKIDIFKPMNNNNGYLVAGKSGSGKSVLINTLLKKLEYRELLIISPKGDEDFKEGLLPNDETEKMVLDMIDKSKNGEYKNTGAIIVLDELITISKIFDKKTIEQINISLTICRSTGLKFIFASQKLQKSSVGLDIGLLTVKILNVEDIANFTESLGINKPKTNPITLKTGQFCIFIDGNEYLLTNQL